MQDVTDAILIVDDWEDDATLLGMSLTSLGLLNPIRIVDSATKAIAYLQGTGPYADRAKYPMPKIILLDLKLPGMDGFEFMDWLKANEEFAGCGVIAVSGLDDVPSIQRAYTLGAKSFVAKPANRADLENLIRAFPAYWVRSEPPSPDGP